MSFEKTFQCARPGLFVLRLFAAINVICVAPLPAAETPSLPPPAGAISLVRDTAANYWALAPASDGHRELIVLPAQSPTAWGPARVPNAERGAWTSVIPQSDRGVLITNAREARRFDPRAPEKGAVALPPDAPRAETVPPPWRLVSRMPSSNHDLSAAVTRGRLYIAGGMTWDWGLPAKNHFFDELWALDPKTWAWSIAAKFSQPRVYCSTVTFDGLVWIVGGDVIDPEGKRRTVTLVETYDPQTGKIARAPDLPFALPAPCTLAAGGRLWAVGSRNRDERGQMASIGPGETAWRVEPEALHHMWALAGTALDDKLYICVPNTGLAVFDPATRKWDVIPGPTKPRSSQVAAWRGEVWIIGGTDITDWSETWIHNPTARTWRRGPSLPARAAWGAAGVIDDQLVVAGGAAPRLTPEGRTFDFSDRTFALSADAIPPPATVSEGRPLPRWSNAKLRGTGDAGLPFTTTRMFSDLKFGRLGSAMLIPAARPDEPRRWLVLEVERAAWTVPDREAVTQADPFFDLPKHLGNNAYTLAVAFHPRYPAVPQAYVFYNNRRPGAAEDVLARFPVELSDPPRIDLQKEEVLLRWPSRGHDGGDLRFGPDGFLYVSVGDRSAPGDPNNLTQRLDLITGGMLRLDVDRADPGKNYAVPKDNPFVGLPDVLPEFWAYGLRNPWRMSFSPTGELWVGDNGDDSWESVHLIRKGHNYGWSTFEGTHPFKRNRPLAGPTPRLTPPIIELPHSEARSVIGGFVYRGKALPALFDHYVFGDYATGAVWAFKWDGTAPQNFRRIAETRAQMLSFAEDRAGEIVMARYDGQIHRLVAAPPPITATAPFPAKLSETGLFASMSGHVAAPGVVPYEINTGVWSDGAQARRLLAVPEWQPVALGEGDAAWNLPDGSTLARTLELPGPRRVETQVMYREHGTWRFYTYAWNEAQTDADLVKTEGETRPVPGIPARQWRFAGRSECTICHTTHTNFTLGLTTAQLNRDADHTSLGRRVENQIVALADAGLIRPAPAKAPAELARKIDPMDASFPLEARARTYLDVNCAHCHRPHGVGGRPGIHFTESVPLARAGVVNAKPLVPLLGPDSLIVAPGRPEQSELLHRIMLEGGGRMPLIGSEQTDKAGAELIRQWIAGLKP